MVGHFERKALVATSLCGAGVAHSLGKGEATGSNPVKGNSENFIWVGARVAKGNRL